MRTGIDGHPLMTPAFFMVHISPGKFGMFIILLTSFFIVFVASVIATLNVHEGRRRRGRGPIKTQQKSRYNGMTFWIDPSLAITTIAHNIVSELREHYSGPIKISRFGEDNSPPISEREWLVIIVISEDKYLTTFHSRCYSGHIIINGGGDIAESWKEELLLLSIPEILPPIDASSLTNPRNLTFFCRKLQLLIDPHHPVYNGTLDFENISIESLSQTTKTELN